MCCMAVYCVYDVKMVRTNAIVILQCSQCWHSIQMVYKICNFLANNTLHARTMSLPGTLTDL